MSGPCICKTPPRPNHDCPFPGHRAHAEALDAVDRFGLRTRVCDARAVAVGYLIAGKYDEAQRWLDEARQLDETKGRLR